MLEKKKSLNNLDCLWISIRRFNMKATFVKTCYRTQGTVQMICRPVIQIPIRLIKDFAKFCFSLWASVYEKKQELSFSSEHQNAKVLVENPSHIQEQIGGEVSAESGIRVIGFRTTGPGRFPSCSFEMLALIFVCLFVVFVILKSWERCRHPSVPSHPRSSRRVCSKNTYCLLTP